MKIELTENELLFVVAMLDNSQKEELKKLKTFTHNLSVGLIGSGQRLSELDDLGRELRKVDSLAVYNKFADAAVKLDLLDF